jgi:type IV pilus assembly protein PilC
MPLYRYIALNEKGRRINGTMTAANEMDLEDRLGVIGLDLITAKQTRESKGSIFRRINIQDLIIFCIHMEQLERAGVPILDSIADLRDTAESPKLKAVMTEVYESIKGGEMLSEALSQHPEVFNNVFTSLIAAGEKTGNLQEIFKHLV